MHKYCWVHRSLVLCVCICILSEKKGVSELSASSTSPGCPNCGTGRASPWSFAVAEAVGAQRGRKVLSPKDGSARAGSGGQVSPGETAHAKQLLAMGGSRGRCGHPGAEQSPELLRDAVPVGSLAGPCLLQSQGEGGAWAYMLPLGSRRSAGVLGCL